MKPILAFLAIVVSLSLAACNGDDIEDLAQSHPGPHNIGVDTPWGGSSGVGGNNVFAKDGYYVPAPSRMIGLGAFVSSLSGATQIRMGVYRDNAGTPANLILGTPPKPIVVGLNYFKVPPTFLPAGSYWIAILMDGSINANTGGASTPTKFFAHSFGAPWPSPFPAHSTLSNAETSFFMRVYR